MNLATFPVETGIDIRRVQILAGGDVSESVAASRKSLHLPVGGVAEVVGIASLPGVYLARVAAATATATAAGISRGRVQILAVFPIFDADAPVGDWRTVVAITAESGDPIDIGPSAVLPALDDDRLDVVEETVEHDAVSFVEKRLAVVPARQYRYQLSVVVGGYVGERARP